MNAYQSFESFFQALPVPTIVLEGNTSDFKVIEVNESFLDFSQRTRKECVGKKIVECFPEWDKETADSLRSALHQVVEEKRLVKSKVQQYSRNSPADIADKSLYFEAILKPILSSNKEIRSIICSLQDISESVHAQQQEQEGLSIKLFAETALPVLDTLEIDSTYLIESSESRQDNFETEESWTLSLKNVLGFFKDSEAKDRFCKTFDEAMSTGKSFEDDFELTTAKGNCSWIRVSGKAEMRQGGAVVVPRITANVSFQNNADLQLIGASDYLGQLVQSIPGVIWEADARSFTVSYISAQITTMLGYSVEECVGQPKFWQNKLHPEGKEEAIRYTLDQVKSCKDFSHHYRVQKKDGSYAWVKILFSVIYENDHLARPRWIRGLIIDVTTSKRHADIEHLEKTVLELNANPQVLLQNVLKTYMAGLEILFPEMICAVIQIKSHLYYWASPSLSPGYESIIKKTLLGETVEANAASTSCKELIVVSDIESNPIWADHKEWALKENLRACWSCPLLNSSGEVMATLALYYSSLKDPSEEEIKLIERTAAMLTLIIEHEEQEELLKETNFLMKQSQELAHFGNIHWDIPSDRLTLSTELYNILGLIPQQKHVLDRHLEYIHPEDRDKVKSKFIDLLTVKNDLVLDERIIRPNGEIRNLRTWVKVERDNQGAPLQLIGTCLDVTENKETEERLRASEQRLRNIMDSQTNYIVRIDLSLQYTFVNKKFFDDFASNGIESLLGLSFLKIFTIDRQQQVIEIVQSCIAQTDRVFTIELEETLFDGSHKLTFWHFVCLTDIHGSALEIQGMGTDISDRKKAEKELKLKNASLEASEIRYRDLFHLSPQPMYVVEKGSLKFLDVNQAAIQQYGYGRKEFLSMTIKDIAPEEEVSELREILINYRKNKTNLHRAIFTHQTKSGEVIQVDVHSNRIVYEGRNAKLVLAHNITSHLDYLKALEIQNKKLKEIAWTQSHVVRAPLARMLGLIETITDNPELIAENTSLLGHMLSSALELDEIIRDISNKAEEARLEGED